MSNETQSVFKFLQIIAWVIFVGLCIKAGGLIVNFSFSLFKPEMVPNLYPSLDLVELYTVSHWSFFAIFAFVLTIAIFKAILFYRVIRLILKLDLNRPFNHFVADQILSISHLTLAIGLISLVGRQLAKNITHRFEIPDSLNHFWSDSQAFLLMGAVIYIIAAIFKKGVKMQNENDLTV